MQNANIDMLSLSDKFPARIPFLSPHYIFSMAAEFGDIFSFSLSQRPEAPARCLFASVIGIQIFTFWQMLFFILFCIVPVFCNVSIAVAHLFVHGDETKLVIVVWIIEIRSFIYRAFVQVSCRTFLPFACVKTTWVLYLDSISKVNSVAIFRSSPHSKKIDAFFFAQPFGYKIT